MWFIIEQKRNDKLWAYGIFFNFLQLELLYKKNLIIFFVKINYFFREYCNKVLIIYK